MRRERRGESKNCLCESTRRTLGKSVKTEVPIVATFSTAEGLLSGEDSRRLHFTRRAADQMRGVNSLSLDIRKGVRETTLGTNSI